MSSVIERYFYHKDRAKELTEAIEALYGSLNHLPIQDEEDVNNFNKEKARIDGKCRGLIAQKKKHQKIVDNLIKKIEQETQIDGDDKKTT